MNSERQYSTNGLKKRSVKTILGLSLAIILTASAIPAAFKFQAAYAEIFKTFDGSDYVAVPSRPDLQLSKFMVEVKFRIHDYADLRGYLVSKSAGFGDGNLDHNYALYVTKYGTVGGAFRAMDGNHYYIYSWPPLSTGVWHVAKLVYDGSELRLRIDGELERSLKVAKTPDTSGTGPLMIGGHSNQKDRFFIGDIDYVAITDRRDYDRVYFNDFGASPPANSPPVASNDSDATDKNVSTKTSVLSNDSDADGDSLSITSVTNPPHGAATINADGTVTYKPDLNFVGTDNYQYTISDGRGGTDTATGTIVVRDVLVNANNPPNAVDDATGTTKGTSVTTNVLSNDNDADGDSLSIASVTNPSHGAATKNSGGTITYTPDAGFVGTDSYQYTISDGLATDTATVTVAVSDTAPPPPPSGSDCSDIPVKNFQGVVFMDNILSKKEEAAPGTVSVAYVTENLKYIKSNGFNTIRVPFYWEAYVNNPSAFMDELDLVAKTAEANDMCIVFANFHFYTSSYWHLAVEGKSGGRGFPSFVVDDFPKRADYIQTAGPFWDAFLSNNISINGRSVWDVQAEYIKKVIDQVDSYDSIVGYEILNEPHLFDKAQYDKLGNYHTFMAKKMRESTDKKIFFDRETTRGFARDASLEYKIIPRDVAGLVYGVQLYSIPTPGSYASKQVSNFNELSQKYGIEVFIEEMAGATQSEIETLLNVFKANGYGWTWYAWKQSSGSEYGVSIYESSTVPPSNVLMMLEAALAKIY